MFSSIVDSVKAVANRFSAPVTGDEHADKAAINKVTGTADDAYGTARDKVCSIHFSVRVRFTIPHMEYNHDRIMNVTMKRGFCRVQFVEDR